MQLLRRPERGLPDDLQQLPAATPMTLDTRPRSTSEAALIHGYAGATTHLETKPCACGGSVTADPQRPAQGVAAHNFSPRHRAWRANQEEIEGDG